MLGNPGVWRREEEQDVRGADDAAVDRRRETERRQRTASEGILDRDMRMLSN